jgi:salicylate hydroxylase
MSASPHALIAGAGIGGLTAALCLSRAGFRVTLLERSKALQTFGAGLQISPNASAILRDLGILPAIVAKALAPVAIHARRGRDGMTLARMPLADAERRWGAPYLLVHRADLQQALVKAVEQTPSIALVTQSALAGFAATENGVALAVLRGNIRVKYDGDCLIGADGLRSLVRERLADGPATLPDRAGRVAFRALVDSKLVPAALRQPESCLWLGRKAHVVHYPLREGSIINLVAVADDAMAIDWKAEFWSQPAESQRVLARFADFDSALRDLLASATEWRCWPLLERPRLASWTKGPIALLGDAAHPMLPFLAQGAAQAIEDAAALGQTLATASTIEAGLAAYQAKRLDRVQRITQESRRQAAIYHLSGPAAFARDLTMRFAGPKRLLDRYDWLYRSQV